MQQYKFAKLILCSGCGIEAGPGGLHSATVPPYIRARRPDRAIARRASHCHRRGAIASAEEREDRTPKPASSAEHFAKERRSRLATLTFPWANPDPRLLPRPHRRWPRWRQPVYRDHLDAVGNIAAEMTVIEGNPPPRFARYLPFPEGGFPARGRPAYAFSVVTSYPGPNPEHASAPTPDEGRLPHVSAACSATTTSRG